MIAVLKPNTSAAQKEQLIAWLRTMVTDVHVSEGKSYTVLGLIGDTQRIDAELLESLDIVETVQRVSEPFKKCSRQFHPDDTVVEAGGISIGGSSPFCIIAGPCSVESEEQVIDIAKRVKAAGGTALRGGAFKPRTSPYDFQGLKTEGLRLLSLAKKETGLPIVSELMALEHLDLFEDVDIIQIGARNVQNFDLLRELGHIHKPILLKRGIAGSIKELLMSAEYIMAGGNEQIILCERGIRTYETSTRNTLDLSAVPVLQEKTHLPVIVDPSHATGFSRFVPPMALAAAAAGASGIMVEVHNDPVHALCDGAQSLTPDQFAALTAKLNRVLEALK